ncbi:hypothetical protein EON77_04115 [bacterium]|nr:MAG: hypothetical protein EON77_04115 [bacterium]
MPGGADPDNRRKMTFSGYSSAQSNLKATIEKLSQIRKAHPALRRGTRSESVTTNDVWTFKMSTSGDTVYVAINRGDDAAPISALPSGPLTELVTGAQVSGPSFSVPPRSTRVFVAR